MIIFDFKRDTFLRETIVYSPAPSTTKKSLLFIVVIFFIFFQNLFFNKILIFL